MSPDFVQLFRALRLETSLLIGVFAVLGLDLVVAHRRTLEERLRLSLWIGALAIVAAMAHGWLGLRGSVFGGVLMFDRLAVATRLGVLALSLLTLGMVRGARVLQHPAEYVAIILIATMGFTLMAAAQQLLVAFLGLELASLSLYVLAGFDKTRPESSEAALKYFLVGGVSAAFLLFGISLIYGITGSIELGEIARQLAVTRLTPLLVVGLVMVLVAFGFKAAAAPFQLWAPDVYEGAPPASAALIASASKLASLVLFTRLLWNGFGATAGSISSLQNMPGWLPVLAIVSGVSILIGNLGALAQGNVRRLLAYSAISHAGTLLLGVIAVGAGGARHLVWPIFYYATTYGVATVGAFGVIAVVDGANPEGCHRLSDLAGLYRRSPLLAGCLAVFILSLAGIPPLAGFFGKFAVFAAALQLGGLQTAAGWLTLFAIAMSAVGLYYYLLILKQALVAKPADQARRVATPTVTAFALLVAAALLLVLGIFPSLVVDRL